MRWWPPLPSAMNSRRSPGRTSPSRRPRTTPDAPTHASSPTPTRTHAQGVATAPSPSRRRGSCPCHRRQVPSGMSITWQNLALDMPASTRITSRSSKGPAGPSADFLHTRISTAASPNAWVRSATSASKLLLTGRGTRLSRRQRGLTGLKKVCLPPADGLLADHLSPGGLRDRHLADDHAQHDPGLLLSRDPGGGLPMYLTLLQDRLNCPATKSDARQQHPSFTVPRDDYDPKNVTHDSTHPVRGASVCCPLPGVR